MWERLQESNPKPGCMAPGHLTDGPGHMSEGDLSQRLCRKEHLSGPSRAVPVGGSVARPPAQDTRARSRESVPGGSRQCLGRSSHVGSSPGSSSWRCHVER